MRRESMRQTTLFLATLALLAGCGHGYKDMMPEVSDGAASAGPVHDEKKIEEVRREASPGHLTSAGAINLSLAQSYLKSGELETALNRANTALETDGNNGNVHALIALIYDRIGDQAKAGAAFQKALALAPTEGSVLNAYGSWLCAHDDFANAAGAFARAKADPFFNRPGLTYFNTGHCLLRAGQPAQAEVELRQAMDASGADVGAVLMSLAQAELAQGSVFEARAFVQRREAISADPDVLELAAKIEDAAGDQAAAARYRARLKAAQEHAGNGGAR
jgi:type IV pilus assembly protein PilF